jgi:hypothetical protein
MATVSPAQRKALDTIRTGRVFMLNDGSTDTKGVTSATVKALRKAGLLTVNGASRIVVKGRAARRLVLTREALSLVSA